MLFTKPILIEYSKPQIKGDEFMKKLIYVLPAVLLVVLSSCTSYNYYKAAINKTDLSSYHTFAWMPQAKADGKNQSNAMADNKIKDATTKSLLSKGLKLSQDTPDLIINYTLTTGQGSRTNLYASYPVYPFGYFGFGWGWGYRPYYYAYGAPFSYYGAVVAEKEHYKEGTLIIDLIDSRTHRIVWRGFGVGEVHKNNEKNIADLPKVVEGILDQLQIMNQVQGKAV